MLLLALAAAVISCHGRVFDAEADWGPGADASPAFAPDGRTVFFARGDGAARRIYVSRRTGRYWSAPKLAPFSGRWMDLEPAMAPDGSYLVFVSNRPQAGDGAPIDGTFGGKLRPGRGGALWRVERRGRGWGEPVRLPDVVNASTATFAPAVARDGSIVFMRPDAVTGRFRLFETRLRAGAYSTPEPLPFGAGQTSEFDPAVAPDRSFVLFFSTRPPSPQGSAELFISRRGPSGWGAPRLFAAGLNATEPRLGPDHRSLYFSAQDGAAAQRIWTMPIPVRGACSAG